MLLDLIVDTKIIRKPEPQNLEQQNNLAVTANVKNDFSITSVWINVYRELEKFLRVLEVILKIDFRQINISTFRDREDTIICISFCKVKMSMAERPRISLLFFLT